MFQMRFVDPYDDNFQDVAAKIHGIPNGRKFEAGFLLKLQEALIYDAVMMFAESVHAFKNIIKPKLITCASSFESFSSGIALVNQVKSVRISNTLNINEVDNDTISHPFSIDYKSK